MTRFNLKSYFGEFGGAYVPEILTPVLHELESTFITAKHDSLFQKELNDLLKKYVGRPTPLTLCRNITYGTHTKLYLKREDLSHGGAHKINQALGQALLAKKMKKHNIIAETGAGQHGIAVAIASSLLKLKCRIYMGDKDIQRQKENVFRIKLMGSEIISINKNGTATLKDACNAAIRDWSKTYKNTHYILGTAAGPHPFPTIVREFQSVIGQETYEQIQSEERCLPNAVIACVGGGSNAIGIFSSFIKHPSVQLIGVEAGGLGIDTDKHSSAIQCGSPGIYFGMKSHLMQSHNGQIIKNSHSIASGLDFPSVGPEHTYLYKTKRVQYVSITDKEAITAFKRLSKYEGIIPALESSHAIAYALKIIRMKPNTQQILIVNLSGRGDKDISTIRKNIETKQDKTNDDTISEII